MLNLFVKSRAFCKTYEENTKVFEYQKHAVLGKCLIEKLLQNFL